MNSLTRIMSYDRTKGNQENCNCEECISVEIPKLSEEEIEQIISERYSDKDEKTKTFIRKALWKHGDRYDYSNVVYIKSSEYVEIICKVEGHEPFPQTPNKHLIGRGCPICGGSKKLTIEEFIDRANVIHGVGIYDYSKTNYINMNTTVIIICPKHGDFPQTPANHLSGKGCQKCQYEKLANDLKLTLEEFITKSNKVHGEGTYNYSKVNYVDMKTEVIIICLNHDIPYEFPQTPSHHLGGSECPLCGGTKKLTLEEFIEKSNEIHGVGTYNYSKVVYVNNSTDVIIICPKHGDFPQTPANHLIGRGCKICGIEKGAENRKLTTEEFIEKSNEIQGIGTYDYSKVKYVDEDTEVIIICPKHGDFPQKPKYHLQGCGCRKCNKNKGEEAVRKFLIEKGIEFEEQKRFNDCRYKLPLPFDFYLPKYNICIESDGNIHSEKINWNGKMTDKEMEENLKSNRLRDKIKNDYCKNNKINLLRVNNLKAYEELTEYFQNL